MATAINNHAHEQASWLAREGWVYCVDIGAVTCYVILSMFAANPVAATGNEAPETSADTLSFMAAGALGAVFGGLASMHLHRMRRFSWQSVRTIGAYSAVFGIGAVPLVFWGFDWPYRIDRIFGVAFAVALCAEMLTNVGGPVLQNAVPAFLETMLRVRADNGQQPRRQAGANQPDTDNGGDG